MNFGEWEVRIEKVYWSPEFDNRVYLIRHSNKLTQVMTHKGEIVTLKEGEAPKSEDVYFAVMSDEQLQAFADALANKGVKTTNDHKNEGLLEAKNAHLEDMRRLVFEPPQEVVRVINQPEQQTKGKRVSP